MTSGGGDSPLPVSMTDRAGRVIYANPAFAGATGFAIDELLGTSLERLRDVDTPPAVLEDLRRTLRSGRPWRALVRIRRRDADPCWFRATVSPVLDAGETVGYLAVFAPPSPAEVAGAQALEAAIVAGTAGRLRFESGRWVRGGTVSRVLRRFDGSLGARHLAGLGVLTAVSVGTLWVALPQGPLLWLATAIDLAVAGALAVAFSRRVVAPLRELERTVERLCAGVLEARSGMDRHDELGRVARALDHLAVNFEAVVRDVRGEPGAANAGALDVEDAAIRVLDVALRTHGLALYAAIESARLGEPGRMLFLLATDARRLARESLEAARRDTTPQSSPDALERGAQTIARLEAASHGLVSALGALGLPPR